MSRLKNKETHFHVFKITLYSVLKPIRKIMVAIYKKKISCSPGDNTAVDIIS